MLRLLRSYQQAVMVQRVDHQALNDHVLMVKVLLMMKRLLLDALMVYVVIDPEIDGMLGSMIIIDAVNQFASLLCDI